MKRFLLFIPVIIITAAGLAQLPKQSSGGSGTGTVTGVTLAGTANQITVTGTCTITTSGTCTFSIPTNPIFPGNVTAGSSFIVGNASSVVFPTNGNLYFNGGTNPSISDVGDKLSLTSFGTTGKLVTYNNIATVAGGVPSILAVADLTAQSAAKTATALYTPAATGLFRISYYAKVTTAATTSSILGGTTGLVLAYTDGTDSVAQTAFTLPEDNQAGTALSVGTGNTTNTTQAVSHGTGIIYALTGVGITYAFGYTSVGGTAMQYELHITVEAM